MDHKKEYEITCFTLQKLRDEIFQLKEKHNHGSIPHGSEDERKIKKLIGRKRDFDLKKKELEIILNLIKED